MSDIEPLLELLRAWLDQNRQSILDGTVSCRTCGALVLDDRHADIHRMWHNRRAEA